MELINESIPGSYSSLNSDSAQKMGQQSGKVTKRKISAKEKEPLTTPSDCWKCNKNALFYFQDFSDKASLDGLKFVGESGRNIIERIFWSIVLICSVVLCLLLVVQTFRKWINSPVIVSFATTQTRTYEIPFPAITICPEIKANKELFNYTQIYLDKFNENEVSENDTKHFEYLSLLCDVDEDLFDGSSQLTNNSALQFLTRIAPDFFDSIFQLEWRGEKIDGDDISDYFTPILTSEGVCYTFNVLDRRELFTDVVEHHENCFTSGDKLTEWSLENGYSKNATLEAYPRRTLLAGSKGGLKITMFIDGTHLDYACGDSLQGFKVTLHNPTEIPRVKENHFRVPLDHSIVAAVKTDMMTTSEELRSYTPTDRKCYFINEKSLKFFKVYNQKNCLLECLTNFTLKLCGCVAFYMPKIESTPICGVYTKECIEEAEAMFMTAEVNAKLSQSKKQKTIPRGWNLTNTQLPDHCDCLPSCYTLDFDVEISQSPWNWKELLELYRQSGYLTKDFQVLLFGERPYLSQMQIFFKDMQFITSERRELYGYTDFWANIGGVIGLFTGFSFITMFEILYYLTLRLTCNIRMHGRRYWSGSEDLFEEDTLNLEQNKAVKS